MALITQNVGGATDPIRIQSAAGVLPIDVNAALKHVYSQAAVADLTIMEYPFLGMLPVKKDFFGLTYQIPVIYGKSHNRSRTLANVVTTGKSTSDTFRAAVWQLTRVKKYATAIIDSETAEIGMAKGPAAFFDVAAKELDSAMEGFSMDIGAQVFRDGYGILADATAAGTTTLTVTLQNRLDHVHFEKGMVIDLIIDPGDNTQSADYSPTAALVKTPIAGFGFIETIDRNAGTFTIALSTNVTTTYSTLTLNSSFILGLALAGDAEVDGNDDLIINHIAGLSTWVPSSAPTSNLFSVDRTADSRLHGIRVDGTSMSIHESLVDAMVEADANGFKIDKFYVGLQAFAALSKEITAKTVWTGSAESASVNYSGIMIQGTRGSAMVMGDPACQKFTAWGITSRLRGEDMLGLCTVGEPVHINNLDGLTQRLDNDADTLRTRIYFMGNMYAAAPGGIARVTINF